MTGMGLGRGNGYGAGSGGVGSGRGGDNSNSGPRGKLKDVKGTEHVSGAVGESGMVFAAGETTGAPDKAASATVPYTDVLPNYRKAAENALSKEKVPPAYRKRVKDYFSSLEQ